MKQTLTLICIVCPLFLCAQTVNHFENGNSRWSVTESYIHASPQNPVGVDTVTTIYGFQGDTVDLNETWFKMYSTTDVTFTTNLEYQGLLRSTNGLVIFQDTTSALDTLYDFNLELGDSVFYDFGWESEYIEVINVDSVSVNGEMFKRLQFSEPTFPQAFTMLFEYWIEGIGSLHSPLFPAQPRVFSTEFPEALVLTCSETNNITYWDNPIYDQCYYNIVLSSPQPERQDFTIYPNPTAGHLYIHNDLKNNEVGQFSVYDLLGKQITSGAVLSGKQLVDISNLKDGLYIITLVVDDKIETRRILKY